MNFITILILVVAVVAIVMGLRRGIVREAVSLCAIVAGVAVVRMFGDAATAVAEVAMGVEPGASSVSHYTASIVGCALLFVAVWIIVYLVGRMLRGVVHAVKLGIIDRLAGAAYCVAKYLLVLSLLLNFIYLLAPSAAMWGADPKAGVCGAILGYAPWLFGVIGQSA